MPSIAGTRTLRLLWMGLVLIVAGVLALPPVHAQTATGDRVALVVGNGRYPGNELPNPPNDARGMADLLQRAGFLVETHLNTTKADLERAIRSFGRRLLDPGVRFAVFYYAGHGFQQDWRNYLVPVDARVSSADQVARATVDVSELVRYMTQARGRNFLVVLDACRDDPFQGQFRPTLKGLSPFDAPVGSVLAYATAPGHVAYDGESGKHGLYTKHLLRELALPEASVEDAFKRVRLNVRLESRGRQVPWEMAALEEDLFLFPRQRQKLSDSELEQRLDQEISAWSRVRGSNRVEDWINYLQQFPSGNTSELAQARLNRLLAEQSQRMAEQARREAEAKALAQREQAQQEADARLAAQREQAQREAEARATAQLPSTVTAAPAGPLPALPKGAGTVAAAAVEAASAPALLALAPPPDISPTPYFQGQFEYQRDWRVGETHEYRLIDKFTGIARPQTFRVTEVDVAGDRVVFNGGEYIADLMGNVMGTPRGRFVTPRQFYPAELVVGKRWRTMFRQQRVSGLTYLYRYDVRVVGKERISVPAGTFETYRIEAHGFNMGLSAQIDRTMWVAPGVNADIATETYVRLASGQVEQNDRQELVAITGR